MTLALLLIVAVLVAAGAVAAFVASRSSAGHHLEQELERAAELEPAGPAVIDLSDEDRQLVDAA